MNTASNFLFPEMADDKRLSAHHTKTLEEMTPHERLMKLHYDRVHFIADGAMQGAAIKKILKTFSEEQAVRCYRDQVEELQPEGWRAVVNWSTVQKGIAEWALKNPVYARPQIPADVQYTFSMASAASALFVASLPDDPTEVVLENLRPMYDPLIFLREHFIEFVGQNLDDEFGALLPQHFAMLKNIVRQLTGDDDDK